MRSRSTKLPAPLAAFVPSLTYPVETHDIGGVFHHAFSHCRFDRHILSVVFRDLFVVCPHTGGTRAPEQFSGTLSNFPEPSSVSGKITTVNDSQFTFSLTGNQNFNNLEFVIDPNTRIEGKLAVGSQATVDYRGEGRQLVATHVAVLPASGIQL